MYRRLAIIAAVCFTFYFGLILSYADEGVKGETKADIENSKTTIKEFGILSGYATSRHDLLEKSKYQLTPIILRLGINVKPWLNKVHLNLPGLVIFEFEPFASPVISPDNNAEIGFNILLKYAFPVTKRIYPYVEGGLGALFMTQHTLEQGSQYNFLPQGGVGLMYLVKDNIGVSLGYRYRHLSNASTKQPNKGINVDMALLGVSLFY